MDWQELFFELVEAEDEKEVSEVLRRAGLPGEANWLPLGGMEDNFSTVSKQQTDPTGGLIEKVISGIDSVLMREAFKCGIDPEGSDAPASMTDNVEPFFGIRDGRPESCTLTERTQLAENIHLVAVGSKQEPSYLGPDRGEGQTPGIWALTPAGVAETRSLAVKK